MVLTSSEGVVATPFNSAGDLTLSNNITCSGNFSVLGTFTFGDASVDSFIVKGRMSSMTAAGASISIDATTYQYSEGIELRYDVADWADVYTLTSFRGMYLRAQNSEANNSGSIYGMELYGVANNVNTSGVWGLLSYAYIKGATAKTIGTAYGVQSELTFDAGASSTTISTELASILAKITGGAANDYTKIHGVIIRSGDMDGASRTYGNGILIEDDSGIAGAITWTKGVSISSACTTGLSISGATTTAISVTGNATDAIKILTGTFTTGLNLGGTLTTGISIGTATKGIHLASSGGAASASGLLMGIGTTGDPSITSTADAKFLEFRCSSGATSGDNRLLYMRYAMTSTGGGECLRAFSVVSGANGTAHGGHISLNLAAGGSISGLGVGMRGQLLLPDSLTLGGTVFGTQSEIYMEGANSDLNGTHAILSILADGNATGVANVLNAIALKGSTGSGKMILNTNSTGATESNGSIRILVDEGSGYVARYIRYWDAQNS